MAQMLLYMLVLSYTPGPNNLTVLYLSSRRGARGTLRFFLASALAFFAKCVLTGLLGEALADILPEVTRWLKWFGAAYMLYLAYIMARSGWREDAMERESAGTFRSGLLLQLLNGKSWIGALTVYGVYVSSGAANIWVASLCFTGLMIAASVLWGAFGVILNRWISKYKKPFGIIMGASLVYCAVTAVLP